MHTCRRLACRIFVSCILTGVGILMALMMTVKAAPPHLGLLVLSYSISISGFFFGFMIPILEPKGLGV